MLTGSAQTGGLTALPVLRVPQCTPSSPICSSAPLHNPDSSPPLHCVLAAHAALAMSSSSNLPLQLCKASGTLNPLYAVPCIEPEPKSNVMFRTSCS